MADNTAATALVVRTKYRLQARSYNTEIANAAQTPVIANSVVAPASPDKPPTPRVSAVAPATVLAQAKNSSQLFRVLRAERSSRTRRNACERAAAANGTP